MKLGRRPWLLGWRTVVTTAVTLVGFVAISLASGLGFGWVEWIVAGLAALVLVVLAVPFLLGRPDYDVDLLVRTLRGLKARYPHLEVILEPGEAAAVDTGVLVASVLDVHENAGVRLALLDVSATCHMPDVLEMPYRPNLLAPEDGELRLAGENGEKAWTCRLAGKSCLAGDVIGEYSFAAPLKAGDRLIFTDMAIYSMVKTTTFNGLRLPSIGSLAADLDAADPAATARFRLVRRFGYEDFKTRLS